MTKAGTEYVRGIPVVKIFQQTVYSFKAFQEAIEDYSKKAEHYQADVCRVPQSLNLTFTEGAFVFLVPVALFLAPGALADRQFCRICYRFRFLCRVFSDHFYCPCKNYVCFLRDDVGRYRFGTYQSGDGCPYPGSSQITHKRPRSNKVEFKDVSFTYDGAETPALSHVSFTADAGADHSAGRTVWRRKDNGSQPDSPFLGCNFRRSRSRRR